MIILTLLVNGTCTLPPLPIVSCKKPTETSSDDAVKETEVTTIPYVFCRSATPAYHVERLRHLYSLASRGLYPERVTAGLREAASQLIARVPNEFIQRYHVEHPRDDEVPKEDASNNDEDQVTSLDDPLDELIYQIKCEKDSETFPKEVVEECSDGSLILYSKFLDRKGNYRGLHNMIFPTSEMLSVITDCGSKRNVKSVALEDTEPLFEGKTLIGSKSLKHSPKLEYLPYYSPPLIVFNPHNNGNIRFVSPQEKISFDELYNKLLSDNGDIEAEKLSEMVKDIINFAKSRLEMKREEPDFEKYLKLWSKKIRREDFFRILGGNYIDLGYTSLDARIFYGEFRTRVSRRNLLERRFGRTSASGDWLVIGTNKNHDFRRLDWAASYDSLNIKGVQISTNPPRIKFSRKRGFEIYVPALDIWLNRGNQVIF